MVSSELTMQTWQSIEAHGHSIFVTSRTTTPNLTSSGLLGVEKMRNSSISLGVPFELLNSYLRTLHTDYIKTVTYAKRNKISAHLKRYLNDGLTIVDIALETGFSPYLMGKMILENINSGAVLLNVFGGLLREKIGAKGAAKWFQKKGGEVLKDVRKHLSNFDDSTIFNPAVLSKRQSSGILNSSSSSILCHDLLEAIEADVYLGPSHDRARRLLGVEFELHLEDRLNNVLKVRMKRASLENENEERSDE